MIGDRGATQLGSSAANAKRSNTPDGE
jgi:hypothetical protein